MEPVDPRLEPWKHQMAGDDCVASRQDGLEPWKHQMAGDDWTRALEASDGR